MGNWVITIQGTGCHHNGKPEIDADLKFKEVVKELKTMGQTIDHASITYGGREYCDGKQL
jgi:hypothetical protein